jgi:hypothetical protein
MTTTQHNRLRRLESVARAHDLGRDAALAGGDETLNPYHVGSYLWCVWGDAFENTRDEMESAIHALAEGRLAKHEAEADMRGVGDEPGLLRRLWAKFGNLMWGASE